jgi:Flp pilus assembly protein TadG
MASVLGDDRGAALIEFALVAPVMILALLGMFDLSYNIYATSLLEGAIQKAGRDATLESGGTRTSAIDGHMREVVHNLVPNATVTFDRQHYADFDDVQRPEDFTDSNGDGACNDGEPFEDVNGSGTWDTERGQSGVGGARDAVLYTVTVTYPRRFPFMRVIGFSDTVTSRARTVLRNQPFGAQNLPATVGNCA